MANPGVLGILSLGGYPGNYTLQAGLTGGVIVKGTPEEILQTLSTILRNEDGSTITVSFK